MCYHYQQSSTVRPTDNMIVPVLYILSFLDAFAFVLVITSLNTYIHSIGGTQFFAGALGSVGALISLISNPIVGSLSDTLGRKKVLLQCLFLALVGNLLTAATSSLTLFFIARVITSFGTQIGLLIKSVADDNIPQEDVKMATMNRMQAFIGICFIFGGIVGGILSELENGFQYLWYLQCAIFTINIVLVSLVVKNQPRVKKTTGSTNRLGEITKAFTNLTKIDWPRYWDLFTIKLIVEFVSIMFHFNFSLVLMERFGITGKGFGYVFASVGIMGIITSFTMPKLKKLLYSNDSAGFKRLFHGCLVLTFTFLGLGLSPNFFVFYVFLLPFPISRTLFETTFTEVILARAGAEEKGSVMGAFESTISLAGLVGPLVSGFISHKWGNNALFLLSIIPLTVGTALAYTQRQAMKTPKKTN